MKNFLRIIAIIIVLVVILFSIFEFLGLMGVLQNTDLAMIINYQNLVDSFVT